MSFILLCLGLKLCMQCYIRVLYEVSEDILSLAIGDNHSYS